MYSAFFEFADKHTTIRVCSSPFEYIMLNPVPFVNATVAVGTLHHFRDVNRTPRLIIPLKVHIDTTKVPSSREKFRKQVISLSNTNICTSKVSCVRCAVWCKQTRLGVTRETLCKFKLERSLI
jgi:hypothetical protein